MQQAVCVHHNRIIDSNAGGVSVLVAVPSLICGSAGDTVAEEP